MDSGAYRHTVTIQKYVDGYDDIGNPVNEWQGWKQAKAYVNGLSGSEYWEAANTQSETTVEFLFRWKAFFDEMNSKQFRLIFNNRIFNIKGNPDNLQFRNKTVKIRAEAVNG